MSVQEFDHLDSKMQDLVCKIGDDIQDEMLVHRSQIPGKPDLVQKALNFLVQNKIIAESEHDDDPCYAIFPDETDAFRFVKETTRDRLTGNNHDRTLARLQCDLKDLETFVDLDLDTFGLRDCAPSDLGDRVKKLREDVEEVFAAKRRKQ
jgi:hypothetical protein